MADLFDAQGKIRKPFMTDDADRPCGQAGCAARAVFFRTATPLATVFGRDHVWLEMWCGDHVPADWLPVRRSAVAA